MRPRALRFSAQGWGALLLLLLCVPVGFAWRDAVAEPLLSPRPVHGETINQVRLAGVASCSAASCHNAGGIQGSARSEYGTWASHDKHAQAYSILFDERSRRIQKNLDPTLQAHENTLCLKCHVSQNYENERLSPGFELADGVHCENCHGEAQGWVAEHYLPGWGVASDAAKASLGFKNTKNLLVRAKSCVECHVGSPRTGADVNHDLIAAGHPRLNFEFSNYLAIYPRHWSLTEDKQRDPDFEAKAWAIGQVVSAQQALNLLAWRAENTDGKRPWPELAEYSCYACHQSLTRDVKRVDPDSPNRPLGKSGWNTWYLTLLPKLTAEHNEQLGAVQQRMKSLGSRPGDVAPDARAAAQALDPAVASMSKRAFPAAETQALIRSIIHDPSQQSAATWDDAAQRYLALTALYQALGDPPTRSERAKLRVGLERLLKALHFEPGYASPSKGYDPGGVAPVMEKLKNDIGR